MGYKKVCIPCRKVNNLGTDFNNRIAGKCNECGATNLLFDHKFRPPKKNNDKKWAVIQFLSEHGFFFQRVAGEYPETMQEAEVFVEKFKDEAINEL